MARTDLWRTAIEEQEACRMEARRKSRPARRPRLIAITCVWALALADRKSVV